jgi:hypothetical protein
MPGKISQQGLGAAAPRQLLTDAGRPSPSLPDPATEAIDPAPSAGFRGGLDGLEHAATSCSREGGAAAVGLGPHLRPHQAEATMVATHLTPAVRGMEEASIGPSSGTP